MSPSTPFFNSHQISQLTKSFHRGAAEASDALARWLNLPITISIDSVDQCPLTTAIDILGEKDATLCVSVMKMEGSLTGYMLLAFDDSSGLAISDLLMDKPAGTATSWGELEVSCVLETTNIAGSAYLNGIATDLTDRGGCPCELIPSPPNFLRDFGESLLESAFMDQALMDSDVVFARTRFDVDGQPLQWTFLLIPDVTSLEILPGILSRLV